MCAAEIKKFVLGMIQTNCYVISNEELKEAIVIDPADDAMKIEAYLQENDLRCQGILLTHGHFDHIMAVNDLVLHTKAKVYAQEEEVALLGDSKRNLSAQTRRECRVVCDVLLQDQQVINLAGFTILVLHTPGHTRGGACYYFPDQKVLISGDTLFYESVGRTDFSTGSEQDLLESIRTKLRPLEDDVTVYPGHGMPTTIGHERRYNNLLNE
jgi:hydroxyacylglutathione hydrolase